MIVLIQGELYPELVSNEMKQWDLSSKEIKQVHKLASAYLNKS